MSNGYLYAAREPGKPEVKIGRTRNDPCIRLGQLNNTGRLHDLEYEFVLAVKDEVSAERIAHDILKKRRVRKDREFFKCSPRRVRAVMKKAAARVGPYKTLSLSTGKTSGLTCRLLHLVVGGSLASVGLMLTAVLSFVLLVDPVARGAYATTMFTLTAFSLVALVYGFRLMRKH